MKPSEIHYVLNELLCDIWASDFYVNVLNSWSALLFFILNNFCGAGDFDVLFT
jgi:hypothetical protein